MGYRMRDATCARVPHVEADVHRTSETEPQRSVHQQDHVRETRREQLPGPVLQTLVPGGLLQISEVIQLYYIIYLILNYNI